MGKTGNTRIRIINYPVYQNPTLDCILSHFNPLNIRMYYFLNTRW
jgi:hypothetical protein